MSAENDRDDWKEVVRRWRELPPDVKQRKRWNSIPRSVARSFDFEGEPVDQVMLELEHAKLTSGLPAPRA